MVKEEIKKFSELHYKDENYIKLNKIIDQLPEKIVKRIQDILFSQLITYITNMNEFNIAKKYIVQIVDEFTEKYNYLSKEQIQGILTAVSTDEKEIEKLRSEYKADTSSKLSENLSKLNEKNTNNININNIKEDEINENDKKNINVDKKNNSIINSKSNIMNEEKNKK